MAHILMEGELAILGMRERLVFIPVKILAHWETRGQLLPMMKRYLVP